MHRVIYIVHKLIYNVDDKLRINFAGSIIGEVFLIFYIRNIDFFPNTDKWLPMVYTIALNHKNISMLPIVYNIAQS